MKENVINSGYSKIHIPEGLCNTVDNSVKHGIRKEKERKFCRGIGIAAAALVIFISTINISPAFAEYMKSIPGFSAFVELFKFDKGIKMAFNNDFVQTVEKSAEDKGIKLTIKSIMFDKRRFILLYTIEANEKYKDIGIQNETKLVDENGKNVAVCGGFGLYYSENAPKSLNKRDGFFEFRIHSGMDLPEELTLNCREMCNVGFDNKNIDRITGNWDISFKIDKKFLEAKPEEITINKEGELGAIKYNIKGVKIYPTAVYVTVDIKESDKFKFVGFKNLRLIDGRGLEYKVTGWTYYPKENEYTFICESTYFIDSKELTLAADGIYYMPQKEQYIIFDIKNKKLIDNIGYGIEYPNTVKENNILDKGYNLRIEFNITDMEIVENSKIQDELSDGIGFDYAVDEKGNKYNIELSMNHVSKDNVIGRTLCLNTGKNSPKILKFKVQFALKGIDARMNEKIK